MSKQKSKKNKCDKLKAKMKKRKKKWLMASEVKVKARKKYLKEYEKFKALLEPYKLDLKEKRKEAKRLKKKYKLAKDDFKKDCQPEVVGKVLVVWRSPENEESAKNTKKKKKKSIHSAKKNAKVKTDKRKNKSKQKVKRDKKSAGVEVPVITPGQPLAEPALFAKTITPKQTKSKSTGRAISIKKMATTKTVNQKVSTQNSSPIITPASPPAVTLPSKDNLKKIEGIGPKIEQLLYAAEIYTFAQLSKTSKDKLQQVLTAAGPRFRMHKPDTWAQQAAIAAKGNWEELKAWQDQLKGGRE